MLRPSTLKIREDTLHRGKILVAATLILFVINWTALRFRSAFLTRSPLVAVPSALFHNIAEFHLPWLPLHIPPIIQ